MKNNEFYFLLHKELTDLTLKCELQNGENVEIKLFQIEKEHFGRDVLAYTKYANDLIKNKDNSFIKIEDIKNIELKK